MGSAPRRLDLKGICRRARLFTLARRGRAKRCFSGNWFLPVSGLGAERPLLIEIGMDSWRRIRAASGRCHTGLGHVTRSHDAL